MQKILKEIEVLEGLYVKVLCGDKTKSPLSEEDKKFLDSIEVEPLKDISECVLHRDTLKLMIMELGGENVQ